MRFMRKDNIILTPKPGSVKVLLGICPAAVIYSLLIVTFDLIMVTFGYRAGRSDAKRVGQVQYVLFP